MQNDDHTKCTEVESRGYTILSGVVPAEDCLQLAADVSEILNASSEGAITAGHSDASTRSKIVGGRNLAKEWSGWREIIATPIVQTILTQLIGDAAGLVRILYFDKPPGKGWSLALHRDKTIAVAEHHSEPEPFGKPTRKAGVPHVEATEELLKQMLTLRLHLDAMHCDNGPLVVVPGTHQSDTVDSDAITINCNAGDMFVMRPLLLHGSRAASITTTDHRRVIHMEFAQALLPSPYRWDQFLPAISSETSHS